MELCVDIIHGRLFIEIGIWEVGGSVFVYYMRGKRGGEMRKLV